MATRLSTFLAELKRRKVYRVAAAYIVVGLGILGAAEVILDPLGLGAARPFIVIITLLGFPLALVLSWAYDIRPDSTPPTDLIDTGESTPDGLPKPAGSTSVEPTGSEEDRPSIAVLAFDDFSPDPADAYFANGMHEEIITQLQKIRGLAVRGRTSVLRYRDDPQPLPEIAASIGVKYILEGSARKAGDQVRLTVQLIDARRDEHLWAENYDRPLSIESLFAVQSDIARQVTAELRAVLTPEEMDRVERRPTQNLEAYDQYLRGRHHALQYTQAGWTAGIEYFEKAIELDPGFALAFAGIGYCYKELAHLEYIPHDEGFAKAEDALIKAIELDDALGEAHATLAAIKVIRDWDMVEAESLFKRAATLSPQSPDVCVQYAAHLGWNGRYDESIAVSREALKLDPLAPLLNVWLGCLYFYALRYDESILQMEAILKLDPTNVWPHLYLTHNYAMLGMCPEGLAHAEHVEEISRSTGNLALLGYVGRNYPQLGRPERAREILEITRELYEQKSIDAVTVAGMYCSLGQREEAFVWLEKAVEERSGLTVYLKVYERTFFEELKSDPRYDRLLERIGFQA